MRYATEDHGKIRREEGFSEGKPPGTILYEMLRHALNLEFGNASIRLHEKAAILTAAEAEATRLDAKFIGVQVGNQVAESRWDLIYRAEPRIVQQGMVVEHIMSLLRTSVVEDSTNHLKEVLAALEILKDSPTARLERCLVEHLDCCHYRLDAWLLSLLHAQLQHLRLGAGDEDSVNRGTYLGAFGWVEDVKSDNREFSPATLDEVQRETFDPDNTGDIVVDSENAGHLHALSNAHALTAAVLRNAYISTASETEADRYKVNLSSERIRLALSIIEGMQQGQGLAELLGYRLERGLHDHNERGAGHLHLRAPESVPTGLEPSEEDGHQARTDRDHTARSRLASRKRSANSTQPNQSPRSKRATSSMGWHCSITSNNRSSRRIRSDSRPAPVWASSGRPPTMSATRSTPRFVD